MIAAQDGHDENGSNSELATTLTVHACVGLSIVAALELAGAHAFPGKTKFHGEECAELRCAGAGAGTAEHIVVFATAQRDRSTAGSRDVLGAVGEQLQSGIEVARGHFSQRVWCEVWEAS